MTEQNSVRKTVMKSLMAVGAAKEAAFYAGLFQQQQPEKFALITIDPRCLRNPLLEALISDLKILSDLGLTPILLVGALDDARTGGRFQAQRLCTALDGASITNTKLNCASYGLIPYVRKIARGGRMVVLEMTEAGRGLDLKGIVGALQPAKVIFLQPSGGFRIDGRRLAVINIDQPETYPDTQHLSKGQSRVLQMVNGLAQATKYHCTYVIVSPLNFLSELFTIKGSGTMLRRGANIRCLRGYKGASNAKLKASIEASFGRTLARDYFKRPINGLYLEENYRGGAIITQLAGLPYLNKFWVEQEAQGEGIARDIWQALKADVPAFFWRSRNDNPFNHWYMKMCDGMQVRGAWRVFWTGLHAPEIPSAILAAANAPIDFENNNKGRGIYENHK